MQVQTLAATAAALSLLAGGQALAAPTTVSTLAPVVVTATRTPQPLDTTLAPATVIDRATIDRLQPRSLPDLLAGQAGIAIANQGGAGKLTSLFLRGSNSNHTLVLIDGIRVGSVTTGAAAIEQIPLDQVQRIEIVRGPRSALYGADAIGGVIQIFTRRARAGEGLVPALRLSAGSRHSADAYAGLSAGDDASWFNAGLGSSYTHGFNSCRRGAAAAGVACFADEPDADGWRSYSGALSGGHVFANGARLSADYLRNVGFVEFDGSAFSGNYSRHVQQVAGAKLDLPLGERVDLGFRLGRSEDGARDYYRHYDAAAARSRQDGVSWLKSRVDDAGAQASWAVTPRQRLTGGVDWRRDHVAGSTDYSRDTRHNSGIFALYQGSFGAEEVSLSARRDHNQQFGNHGTGALALGHHFDNGLLLSASWASAFHAPTFNDLYYPSFPGFAPAADPHLKPEQARNLELDLSARHAHWHWQASVYRNRIKDLIVLDENFTPANIGRARIVGFDAAAGGDWRAWTWLASGSWLKPENRAAGSDRGNLLPRRFQRSLRLDLDRALGAFSLGTTLRAFDHRYDDAANQHRLGGYALWDLRGSYRFQPHWRAELAIDNVLDRRYETVYYYRQPGRTLMATLRYLP